MPIEDVPRLPRTGRAAARPPGTQGTQPAWVARLIECARTWRECVDPAVRDGARQELWILLGVGLAQAFRGSHRLLRLAPEAQADLVAEKALELIERIVEGTWNPAASGPLEVRAMLRAVARNSVVDELRRRRGMVTAPPERADEGEAGTLRASPAPTSGLDELVRREYAAALIDCVRRLQSRARRIWTLSVFHELSSREIGAHPEVALSPQAVDMAAHRARVRVRACMESKGFRVDHIPAGCFVALWVELAREGDAGGEERG